MSRTSDDGIDEVGPPPLPRLSPPITIALAHPSGDDLDLIHAWMSAPHVAERWNQAWPRDRWREELTTQLAGHASRPCLVSVDSVRIAYVEIYRVVRDGLADHYPADSHDLGVHIAIGDPDRCGKGLGTDLLRAIALGLLDADTRCARVVAEPDHENVPSTTAFMRAGFERAGQVEFRHKTADLMVRSRETD